MGEFDALTAEIYREKVRRARLMSPDEKFRAVFELSENVFSRMKAGIKMRFPGSDDAEQLVLLRKQLDRLRSLHEHGLYRPVSNGATPAWKP